MNSQKVLGLNLTKTTLPDAIAAMVEAWYEAQGVDSVEQPKPQKPREYDPDETQIRFTVDLPESLHRRLKLEAINRRQPMTNVSRDALADWLDLEEAQ